MRPNQVSREEKKERIEHHMREILTLLELISQMDEVWKKHQRIEMYVDEIFSGLITPISLKSPWSKTRWGVRGDGARQKYKDITVTTAHANINLAETTMVNRSGLHSG